MSKLSKKDVKHIAKLAKLKLSKSEIDKFSKQLSEIITYVGQLSKVDTSKIEPTSQTTGLENVTRKDERIPEDILTQQEALSGTEKIHNGYFVVDAVLSQKDE
ncbi:MAG: Asp-tRNA(Asn)/Glu-tRNA(Gln) amidotransferase subunit GatC [Patescibacteria group bacterium]|jgi:aspartyl-tRNA(Asn)/glutamyl-tRNA(Gln) amidotransferase subunit C